MSLCFLTFSRVVPNTELFINFKKSFSKSFLACWLLPDWTRLPRVLFLVLTDDPVPASEFLCVWNNFSCHTDYTRVLHIYQCSFFLVRMVDPYIAHVASWNINFENVWESSFVTLICHSSKQLLCPFKTIHEQLFSIACLWRLFTSQYKRYEDCLHVS